MHGSFIFSSNKENKQFKNPKKQDAREYGKEKSLRTRQREQARKMKRFLWTEEV